MTSPILCVVGADRVPIVSGLDRAMFGYFAAERAAELVIAGSGIPWTTLRSTQFHDLQLTAVEQMARLPIVPVPAGVRFQPIHAGEVAARLADLALGDPVGLAPDIAGPRIYAMSDLVRTYLRARGMHRPMFTLWLPGRAARAFRSGASLAPDHATGRRTWEEFLATRLTPPAAAPD